MTRRDEAGRDRSAKRSGVPVRSTEPVRSGVPVERLAAAGISAPGARATGARATGPRAADTSRLGAVLLLIGITSTSLLIYFTEWPWWAIFALIALPFLTASVWCEIRAAKRSAAVGVEDRGPSTQ